MLEVTEIVYSGGGVDLGCHGYLAKACTPGPAPEAGPHRQGDGMPASIRLASVTLDCPDAGRLAAFYAEITGGTVTNLGEHWATVVGPNGRMDFQTVSGYTPPSWPCAGSSIMMHLDFHVDDRTAAEERVLAAGAVKYEFQPNSGQCYVYADPAGHPFCLTTWEDMRPQPSSFVD
jgi:hypothetical protein